MKRIIETLLTIKSTGSALKRLTLGLAVSAAVVLGTGLSANAAAPANDNFADAINLPGATGTQTGTDTIDATLQAGEPDPGAINTVWFKWTCPADGDLTVDTFGSTTDGGGQWDAILGIYRGTAVNALTPLGNSPQDTGVPETMTVPVTAGTNYYIQLAGYVNIVATNIVLNWSLVETVYGADITQFGPGGVIDQGAKTILWTVPLGANPATLAPTFTLSPYATCTVGGTPVVSGDTVNFSGGPVVFKVTAKGSSPTVNDYTVTLKYVPTLIWTTTSGDWDFTTTNWIEQSSGLSQLYVDDVSVIFNNPLGGAINITSAVLPTSTTVSNGDYTISGGSINGIGSLTKTGSGTLTLASANSYTGETVVNAGTLVANGNVAIAGSPSFTVAGGATLLLSGATGGTYKWPATKATLTGAGTVRIPLGNGVNDGLNFDMSTFTGILDLTNGMVAVLPTYSPSFVSPTNGTIRVEPRASLYLGWTGYRLNTTVELYGGPDYDAYGQLRGDTATLDGAVILKTNATFGCAGGTFTINAVISDGGRGFGWTTVQNGTFILNATNNYSGTTIVKSGTVRCNNTKALGGSALSISSPGVVNLNYTGEQVVAALTLGGVVQAGNTTYGSSSSGAANQNNTYFSGTGVVRVPGSSQKDITSFYFGALGGPTVTGTNMAMIVPVGTDVTQLAPTYTVSPYASGSPVSGTPLDFTSPVTYTVTAQDGSTKQYLVTVTFGVLANLLTWTNTVSGNWSEAANWTNELALLQAPLGGGQPSYTLNFNEAGTYTANNDLSAGFLLNQLNLGGPTLTLAGNGLAFAANGATLPQINQDSAVTCTISVPVNLATNTTVGGIGAGQVTLAGAISGPGSLTKTNPGTLMFTGAPSHTGGTHVIAGTLYLNAAATGFAPNAAAFTMADVTVESGATLEGFRARIAGGKLTLNGGTYFEYNGYNDGAWDGPIYLAADSYFGRPTGDSYSQTLRGQISGPGGFTFTTITLNTILTLTASNSYAGPTIVNSGTLRCNNRDALGTNALSITAPGLVNLNYTGDKVVASLTLDGTPYGPGTYGSGSYSAYFLGAGTVSVPGPAQITSFAVAGYAGAIDHTALTILVRVPYGTAVTALKPTYTLRSGTCDKDNGGPTAYDFSSPVIYTVTDGAVVQAYTVTFELSKQTFDVVPPVQQWSTLNVGGAAGDITTVAGMDSMVQASLAANISTALGTSATVPPSVANLARFNTAQLLLQLRPSTTKAVVLMTRVVNQSGGGLYGLKITYDMGTPTTPVNVEEVPGLRAYYSLTGLANSWTAIPALCTATAGTLTADVAFSSTWNNGSVMYLLWAQDNNAAATDNAYTIDNASFAYWVPPATTPPTITGITGPVGGYLTISGFATPGNIVTWKATTLNPSDWTPIQTNAVSGNYSIPVPMGTGSAGFFRTRFE